MFMRLLQTLGFTGVSVLALSLSSVPAFAMTSTSESNSTSTVTNSDGSSTATIDSHTATNSTSGHKATKEAKQDAAKLKACQKRATAGNKKLQQAAVRGQKQINTISNVAVRDQSTYARRGKTLSNYDSLVSDVTAKKAAAQAAVMIVKNDQVSSNCDGTDTKDKDPASSFKSDLKAETTALKDYKTAVKNLTVGIKSVQGTSNSSSRTAKPSESTN